MHKEMYETNSQTQKNATEFWYTQIIIVLKDRGMRYLNISAFATNADNNPTSYLQPWSGKEHV